MDDANKTEGSAPTKSIEELRAEWQASAHAMQSGIAMQLERGSTCATPKHLRVGLNVALRDQGSLVALLIKKGLFTEAEYVEAIAAGMATEVEETERVLSQEFGVTIKLA